MIPREKWEWFGHAGHLIVAQWCRFHLCTLVGDHMVSTVGEYWPERSSREIHARIDDPAWLVENAHLKGDDFDFAYMKKFGFHEIGYNRTYETMVFRSTERCTDPECGCGIPTPSDWSELASDVYNDAGAATRGHYAMCEKFAAEESTLTTGQRPSVEEKA